MDDLKRNFLILFLILGLTSLVSLTSFALLGRAGAEVEYISPENQKALESQFDESAFSAATDGPTLQGRTWNCVMFGVRSHLQVQRNLKLYKWSLREQKWHNEGAQLVSDYAPQGPALVGVKDKFEDQVKITKNGQLISRLSLNSAAKTIVAYSICKIL